jgi:predicted lipoprotein with Yx(FWY)xxD motif
MIGSGQQQHAQARRPRRPSRLAICAIAVTLAFAASFAAVALASSPSVTVGSASNAALSEQIAVSAQGRTLYTLSGETVSHLKCKTKECLKFWPPLTVPSRKTRLKGGPGLSGRLGILRRSNGTFQVTVRGKPVYRFFKDHANGEANGQGIESFGGTWSALPASSQPAGAAPAPQPMPAPQPAPYPEPYAQATPTTAAPTPTPTPTPSPPYGY